MDEALDLQFASGLQQNQGASDVGLNGVGRLSNAAINVRFCCEMAYGIASSHGRFDGKRIADVAFYKNVSGIALQVSKVPEVPSVGQLVKVDDGVSLFE